MCLFDEIEFIRYVFIFMFVNILCDTPKQVIFIYICMPLIDTPITFKFIYSFPRSYGVQFV